MIDQVIAHLEALAKFDSPEPDPALLAEAIRTLQGGFHISKDGAAAVGEHHFLPMDSCPTGALVQLHTPHGIVIHNKITNKDRGDYQGWYPVPRKRIA